MKKKITLGLGSIALLAIPVVSVVSCGPSEDADNIDITKAVSYMKSGLFVDSDKFTPIKEKSRISLKQFLTENRKLKDGEYVEVKDDSVVLADAYYTGEVQDISKIYNNKKKDAFKNMNATPTFQYIGTSAVLPKITNPNPYAGMRPVIEMGSKDSLIYFFDADDNDGRSLYGFKKQIKFEDSSIIGPAGTAGRIINKINSIIGLTKEPNSQTHSRVPFIGSRNKGILSSYYGSQNNHSGTMIKATEKKTWEAIEKHLRAIFPQSVATTIMKYYEKASKRFIPTEIPFGYIKYEVIGPNAIKVDFSDKPNVTASHIGVVTDNGNKHEWDAEISIGNKHEWSAYNRDEIGNNYAEKYLIIGKHKTN